MIKKNLLFLLGGLSLILGTVGIITPLLPTTPFLLLSIYAFGKSSEKCHKFILENRIFGQYIRDYQEKRGITLKNKINAIILLSLSIGFSMWKIHSLHLKIFLGAIFICVFFHIIKLRTLK